MERLSRYTCNPSKYHLHVVQRVLKYLKGTMNYNLNYSGYPLVLEDYTNISWVTHTEDHSSTSGWVFTLVNMLYLGVPRNKLALPTLPWLQNS